MLRRAVGGGIGLRGPAWARPALDSTTKDTPYKAVCMLTDVIFWNFQERCE